MIIKCHGIAVLCVFLLSILTSPVAKSQVIVDVNGQEYHFPTSIKLSRLWPVLQEPDKVYWPAAALYFKDDTTFKKRQNLLHKLTMRVQLIRQMKQPQKAQSLENFIVWLQQQTLARRVEVIIDYERSRHVSALNPLLTAGYYYLSARRADAKIELIGATNEPAEKVIQSEIVSVADLYNRYASPAADKSWLFWSAGQQWHKNGVAYWNAQDVQVSAGSMVYIPFSEEVLGDNAAQLNQQVLELLHFRVR